MTSVILFPEERKVNITIFINSDLQSNRYNVRGWGFRGIKCFLTKRGLTYTISFAICWPPFNTGRMWHAQFATPSFLRNLKLVYCYNIVTSIHQPYIWSRDNFVRWQLLILFLQKWYEPDLFGERRICCTSHFLFFYIALIDRPSSSLCRFRMFI